MEEFFELILRGIAIILSLFVLIALAIPCMWVLSRIFLFFFGLPG